MRLSDGIRFKKQMKLLGTNNDGVFLFTWATIQLLRNWNSDIIITF